MTTKATTQLGARSRYLVGGQTVILRDSVGWWNRTIFSTSVDDVQLILGPKYHQKPYLVAHDIYGKADLMWFVLQYNNIIDVTTEFIEGITIMLPLPRRLQMNLL
jgi:hypothetical protein